MTDTDHAWRAWGNQDPYYGVLSHEKFRAGSLETNRDEFFQTGEDYIDARLQKVERHFGTLGRVRALDFGCGVGRLTIPLARRFGNTVGIDISTVMLAEAQANAQRAGVTNLTFGTSDDALSEAKGEFDFVNTYIVLQHIPVSRGLVIIDQLLRRVGPGGGISLHFSIDRRDGLVGKARYLAQRYVPGTQNLVNLVRGRKWREPLMQMNAYPLPMVIGKLSEAGFASVLMEPEDHGGIMTVNMLARRA